MSSLLSSLLLQIHLSVKTPELDRYAEVQHIQRYSSQVFIKYTNWEIVKDFHSSAMEILDMKLVVHSVCADVGVRGGLGLSTGFSIQQPCPVTT